MGKYFAFILSVMICAVFWPSEGFSQVSDLDFSKELGELSKNDVARSETTSESINEDYNWTADLDQIAMDGLVIKNAAQTKKIDEMISTCERLRRPPEKPVVLFRIKCRFNSCVKEKAVRTCEDQGARYGTEDGDRCWKSLIPNLKAADREDNARRARNKEKSEAANKRYRTAMLSYCDRHDATLKSGELPDGFYPSWDDFDKDNLEKASGSLDETLAEMAKNSMANAKAERDIKEAQDKAKREADRIRQTEAAIAKRHSEIAPYCNERVSKGYCPCSCSHMCTPPPPTPGVSQVCEK